MDHSDMSPDEPLGTETFEQGDEAAGEASRLDPEFEEQVELDPSLDPALQVDERELEEIGAELDDPEQLAVLDGASTTPTGWRSVDPHPVAPGRRRGLGPRRPGHAGRRPRRGGHVGADD